MVKIVFSLSSILLELIFTVKKNHIIRKAVGKRRDL